MQEAAHDEHLWVRWHAEPLPEWEDELRLNPDWEADQVLKAKDDKYGFRRVKRLSGNVGYVEVRYFYRAAWAGEAAEAAMQRLAGVDALIFDLRKCSGGYPDMITRLCGYLFGRDPLHLSSIYWRDEERTQEFWTSPDLAGIDFSQTPVYVLTSRETFSGGEAFAYCLQARKRAVIVGERTGGGTNPGTALRLQAHFEAFIPVGRVIDPLTGKDWEGTGVKPDIPARREQALRRAYRMAVEKQE